jgi:hypothetical protein
VNSSMPSLVLSSVNSEWNHCWPWTSCVLHCYDSYNVFLAFVWLADTAQVFFLCETNLVVPCNLWTSNLTNKKFV